MDGIYFIVLLVFAALTGALLALCAALTSGTSQRAEQDGASTSAQKKNSAQDRGLS